MRLKLFISFLISFLLFSYATPTIFAAIDLTRTIRPIQEPANMFLLGISLIGVASVGRSKFFKNSHGK